VLKGRGIVLVKIVGGLLTFLACGAYGLAGAKSLDNRVRQLKSIRFALAILEKEITYLQNPLPRALQKTALLAEPPTRQFLAVAAGCLERRGGVTAEEAWLEGIKTLQENSDLSETDLFLLQSFASRLGMSDTEEQKKAFQLLGEEIKQLEDSAFKTAATEKKLWTYGGFLLGTLVVLLLL